MPTLADIYSYIDTQKRKAAGAIRSPLSTLAEMAALAGDEARQINRETALSSQGRRQEIAGQPMSPEQEAARQALMERAGEAALGGMVVWHGSPYKFTKFDANKIGSGEGQQVYGHGLYFAEAPKVAEGYQKRLAGGTDPYTYNWQGKQYEGGVKGDPTAHALGLSYHQSPQVARRIAKDGIEASKAGEPWALDMGGREYYEKMYEAASQIKKKDIKAMQGALYKVDLPDEKIAQMLHWDKPVPEEMRKKLSSAMMERFGSGATGTSGEKLYKEIQQEFKMAGSKNPAHDASMFLKEQGIPGIRYLDADSFAASLRQPSAKGTSNFVVFDPADVQILERNAQPLK